MEAIKISSNGWKKFDEQKPSSGTSCFIANKAGDDYLVGIYHNEDNFEHITPIGGGSNDFEWDFYDYGYWIEYSIELPSLFDN